MQATSWSTVAPRPIRVFKSPQSSTESGLPRSLIRSAAVIFKGFKYNHPGKRNSSSHMFRLLKFFLIFLATATVFAVALHQPLLSALGNLVVYKSDDFDHADAAVVLCGAIPGRALQAADLLLESKVDRAILTREQKPRPYERLDELGVDYSEHHEINQAVLLKLGVEAGRINILS